MSDGDRAGGRTRRSRTGIPIGVERALYAAAVDPGFFEELLRDPEAAARARDLALKESELAILRHTPAEQLRAAVHGMDTSPASLERRAFLGVVAAGAAVASIGGCGDDETVKGIRPDAWPDALPDLGDPTRGIRPDDAGTPEAAPPEAGADTVAPPDLASFGIRPGD